MTSSHSTLITAAALARHVGDPDWVVVDCRFQLGAPDAGRAAHRLSHIPGAVYAHLDEDLCGTIVRGKTGRHPLPRVADFRATASQWGIDHSVQVVAYDAAGGAMAAARLWWMMRWLGHDRVAVLDGGWPAWLSSQQAVRGGEERPARRRFVPRERADLAADAALLERVHRDASWRVLDARSADRFRGENETIDPVAGRIPGAVSAPYGDNLGWESTFRSPDELRARYAALIGDVAVERVVCYCGSGVTAAHDVLAMAHAGMGMPRLYGGSWSDWILDPERPVATG